MAEGLTTDNPLFYRIRAPRAEKKVIKSLPPDEVSRLLTTFDISFDDKRKKAMLLILVDYGLRLGELLRLRLGDVDIEHQLLKVSGKTGERVVSFGTATAKALLKYLLARSKLDGSTDSLWLTGKGATLKAESVENNIQKTITENWHSYSSLSAEAHLCYSVAKEWW